MLLRTDDYTLQKQRKALRDGVTCSTVWALQTSLSPPTCCMAHFPLQNQSVRHEALTSGKEKGLTPLYAATRQGHLPVVQYLMQVHACPRVL